MKSKNQILWIPNGFRLDLWKGETRSRVKVPIVDSEGECERKGLVLYVLPENVVALNVNTLHSSI